MTKSIEAGVALKDAEPVVGQHAPEIRASRHLVGMPNRAILRHLGAGREVRARVESPERAGETHAPESTWRRLIVPGGRGAFVDAGRDSNARRLDGVAGGEFLDDRIRRRE